MDVGHNAAVSDGDGAEQLAQLLVVPDGQLDVPRHNPRLLVIPSSVPSQFQHLQLLKFHKINLYSQQQN